MGGSFFHKTDFVYQVSGTGRLYQHQYIVAVVVAYIPADGKLLAAFGRPFVHYGKAGGWVFFKKVAENKFRLGLAVGVYVPLNIDLYALVQVFRHFPGTARFDDVPDGVKNGILGIGALQGEAKNQHPQPSNRIDPPVLHFQ